MAKPIKPPENTPEPKKPCEHRIRETGNTRPHPFDRYGKQYEAKCVHCGVVAWDWAS